MHDVRTCSCRCVTGVRAGGSWRSAAGVRPLPLRQPGGCGASVTGGGGAGASVTGSRTVTVTGASRTWSGVSRSGSCRCTVSGVSRSERRRCCGPRATWSATGCTMMTGTGASATWSATWSGRAGPAARGAGCGAGRAGASQTPPGGPRLHHPNGDYGCGGGKGGQRDQQHPQRPTQHCTARLVERETQERAFLGLQDRECSQKGKALPHAHPSPASQSVHPPPPAMVLVGRSKRLGRRNVARARLHRKVWRNHTHPRHACKTKRGWLQCHPHRPTTPGCHLNKLLAVTSLK